MKQVLNVVTRRKKLNVKHFLVLGCNGWLETERSAVPVAWELASLNQFN
jgi:hypothetical protein